MIHLEGVKKDYGSQVVLDAVDLHIASKQLVALIGPNGAGKSTLLSLISRLLKKDDGYLYIKGREVETWASQDLAKELSLLKQQLHYHVALTVEELVAFGRFPYSKGRLTTTDYDQINHAIYQMELESLRLKNIHQLSGGQLQRVFIAMVLAQDTDIILLDEPLNNLDLKQSILMMRTLRRLVDELGKTVIVVIHDINTASQFADQMIAFKQGQLFCSGTPQEVMDKTVLEALYDVELTLIEVNGKHLCIYQ